ncbi:tyrosine-type recombinase/integrase [Saccharopolyspora spinosa]|uniref:Integrase-like protein n=1 Tax=Saccharopolyspora spinosa TaxID=60894 RepID=A0A2N3Y8D7_SACSN|nr:site-specific integrase [Saccharopolyspora spinosa]PKW19196.1 integrase-like protein [Saccharopolyspora spinosa]
MAWVEKRGDGFRVRYRLNDGTIFTENGFAAQQDADNRAADVESDQRRRRFTDPRLAQTTIDEWIRAWSDAHRVADVTWATYDSHIRNHILPRWSGTALGDIARIAVKGWVNKTLRANLADKSAQDILVLFSMILGEAVDEGLIGTNPCRKLRISFDDRPERPHATTDEVDALAGRVAPEAGLLTITAAYTGLRWGELARLQWIRTYLDDAPRIEVDPKFGALHEVRGRLELGSPKTPASVRTVHLPPFMADQLAGHRERNPDARFVFTGAHGGLRRRSNFRRRVWLPALAGDEEQGWAPLNQEMHFHDLRHRHEPRRGPGDVRRFRDPPPEWGGDRFCAVHLVTRAVPRRIRILRRRKVDGAGDESVGHLLGAVNDDYGVRVFDPMDGRAQPLIDTAPFEIRVLRCKHSGA